MVDAYQEFSNINDVITRFLTLVEEKMLLSDKQKENMLVLENAKTSMVTALKRQMHAIDYFESLRGFFRFAAVLIYFAKEA